MWSTVRHASRGWWSRSARPSPATFANTAAIGDARCVDHVADVAFVVAVAGVAAVASQSPTTASIRRVPGRQAVICDEARNTPTESERSRNDCPTFVGFANRDIASVTAAVACSALPTVGGGNERESPTMDHSAQTEIVDARRLSFAERLDRQTEACLSRAASATGGSGNDLLSLGGGIVHDVGAVVLTLCSFADKGAEIDEVAVAWDELAALLRKASAWTDAAPLHEGAQAIGLFLKWRFFVCSLFCCSALDRDSARQLANVLRGDFGIVTLVDPLAGSGWQASLLNDAGLRVRCSDAEPGPVKWASVSCCDALSLCWGEDVSLRSSALILSWPPLVPHDVGADILRAYRGDVLVYIGEDSEDSVTGGAEFHELLIDDWELRHRLETACWPGFHDAIFVYTRKRSGPYFAGEIDDAVDTSEIDWRQAAGVASPVTFPK